MVNGAHRVSCGLPVPCWGVANPLTAMWIWRLETGTGPAVHDDPAGSGHLTPPP